MTIDWLFQKKNHFKFFLLWCAEQQRKLNKTVAELEITLSHLQIPFLSIQMQYLQHYIKYFPLIKRDLGDHMPWLSPIYLADCLVMRKKDIHAIFSRIKKLTVNSLAMSRSQYPKEKIKTEMSEETDES